MDRHEHPFYDREIYPTREQEYIEQVLKKFEKESVSEELQKKIWDELQREKFLGNVTIPFKVVLRRDRTGRFPDRIEIILDTKV